MWSSTQATVWGDEAVYPLFCYSAVCPNLLLSSFHHYMLPVNGFPQLGFTTGSFSLHLRIWLWFCLCFQFIIRETHNLQGRLQVRWNGAALWNLWKPPPPGADKQKDPLRKQHLSGRTKETVEGEQASEAAFRNFSFHFTDFTETSMGIKKIIINGDQTTQLRVNFQIGWT